jgi:hypothetical protein
MNYDKEYLRLWYIAQKRFKPYNLKSKPPENTAEVVEELSRRYATVYMLLTGTRYNPPTETTEQMLRRIEGNVNRVLAA